MTRAIPLRILRALCASIALLCVSACPVGPDYRRPALEIPTQFKEGADWERARSNARGAIASQWWSSYNDAQLSAYIEQSLDANPSIAAAEAAYRGAKAIVAADNAALYPSLDANVSATRGRRSSGLSSSAIGGNLTNVGTSAATSTSTSSAAGVRNQFSALLNASWEVDVWGQIRRQIESGRENARATDAQLAGQRLSIAASVAANYFALRQADIDIRLLEQQVDIDRRLLDMVRANFLHGTASGDAVLVAQDTLETAIFNLQDSRIQREQYEHAIAVLVGSPPAHFSIAPLPDYDFSMPPVPLALPSTLLQRRPDVVAAEHLAASANARIGLARAAFFPTLDISADTGFFNNTFAHLFSLPNRIWSVGPALSDTLFDAGARSAQVAEAEANYDEDVANYRQAVLTAFQNVEDSLSSCNHLRDKIAALGNIYQRNRQLYGSTEAQLSAGTASTQTLLTQQLLLLQAQQNLKDAQGQLLQSSVLLVKNLGGGWREEDSPQNASAAPDATREERAEQQAQERNTRRNIRPPEAGN